LVIERHGSLVAVPVGEVSKISAELAQEDWYRASDATCCPTGKAATV
jgi:hypothetical protein